MMGTSAETITVRVPMAFRKRGGRKLVITPDGQAVARPAPVRIDSTLVKALARAFRWRRMLESGAVGTVTEIATKERINPSYVSRVLRLTLLAPEIVEAILDGRQAAKIQLPVLMRPVPIDWRDQQIMLNRVDSTAAKRPRILQRTHSRCVSRQSGPAPTTALCGGSV
jgi:hypothetical protein